MIAKPIHEIALSGLAIGHIDAGSRVLAVSSFGATYHRGPSALTLAVARSSSPLFIDMLWNRPSAAAGVTGRPVPLRWAVPA